MRWFDAPIRLGLQRSSENCHRMSRPAEWAGMHPCNRSGTRLTASCSPSPPPYQRTDGILMRYSYKTSGANPMQLVPEYSFWYDCEASKDSGVSLHVTA